MKIAPYVKKLENSKEYKQFREKYPESFLAAAFFVLDFDTGNNMHQIDFYIPSQKKFAAFSLDGGVKMKILESFIKKVPEKLTLTTNVDLDALPGILEDEMHNRGISEEIRKIIAVLQNIDGKKIWNLNCVLTGMEILKSHVEDESKTVLKIEKTSFMDIMKKISVQQPQAVPQVATPKDPKELKEAIKQIDALESELEKEKGELAKKFKNEKTPAKNKKKDD